MIAPQVNTSLLNDMTNHKGKRTKSLEQRKKINDAISALTRKDVTQGIAARADSYSYFNEAENALELIDSAITRYGNNPRFLRSKVKALIYLGDWTSIKENLEDILLNEKIDEVKDIAETYFHVSHLYLDNSGNFSKVFERYRAEIDYIEDIIERINIANGVLALEGIELSVFRQLIGIAQKTMYSLYNHPYDNSSLRITNGIQQIFSCIDFTFEEVEDLTKAINKAIMNVDDIDFQIAADDIEVFCINFSADKLPKDFSYYNAEDTELVELVETRMREVSPNDLEGEELHV